MAKTYFNRYIWLIDTIQQHGHITLTDINDLWQRSALNEDGSYLPARTFHNHRAAIQDIFGIEIEFDKSLGYYVKNEDINSDGVRGWLMTSLSVNNLLNESSTLRDRILLENIPSGMGFLEKIITAMKEGKALEMKYRKFTDAQPLAKTVAPYGLKLFKQRWYLIARPYDGKSPKIYALDRICEILQTRRNFIIPAGFNVEEYFSDWFGIVHDDTNYKPEIIRLRVYGRQRDYFRTLPLHHSQKEVETNAEWSVFEYYMAPTWDLERELLQYGGDIEVIVPDSLRDMMIEHAWNMLHLYKEA